MRFTKSKIQYAVRKFTEITGLYVPLDEDVLARLYRRHGGYSKSLCVEYLISVLGYRHDLVPAIAQACNASKQYVMRIAKHVLE